MFVWKDANAIAFHAAVASVCLPACLDFLRSIWEPPDIWPVDTPCSNYALPNLGHTKKYDTSWSDRHSLCEVCFELAEQPQGIAAPRRCLSYLRTVAKYVGRARKNYIQALKCVAIARMEMFCTAGLQRTPARVPCPNLSIFETTDTLRLRTIFGSANIAGGQAESCLR